MARRRMTDHHRASDPFEQKVRDSFRDSRIAKGTGFDYHDVRWDDVQGMVLPGLSVSAPTVTQYGTSGFYGYAFQYNQDDSLHFFFQTQHRWKTTTPLNVHVHWIPVSNGSPSVVRWQYRYAWADYGQTVATSGWTLGIKDHTVGTSDGSKATITSLVSVNPTANAKESSILLFNITRLGASSAADTYNYSAFLLGVDAHFQAEKWGTFTEIP